MDNNASILKERKWFSRSKMV